MEQKKIEEILIKTAFICMASDGSIDQSEINLIQSMCKNSSMFKAIEFEKEINNLVIEINKRSHEFIQQYFELLKNSTFNEKEELLIMEFAINTILADDKIEYSEIKIFKVIRSYLKLSDEKIVEINPEVRRFLEKDIDVKSKETDITKRLFESINLPKFDLISLFRENRTKK